MTRSSSTEMGLAQHTGVDSKDWTWKSGTHQLNYLEDAAPALYVGHIPEFDPVRIASVFVGQKIHVVRATVPLVILASSLEVLKCNISHFLPASAIK